jgi:hypothetical protein
MGSKYTNKDLKQIAELMEAYGSSTPREPEDDSRDLMEMLQSQFMVMQQNPDNEQHDPFITLIEQELETACVKRVFCGYASLRLHGKSTRKRIYW